MFSMFFGAGNVVFPLALGLDTQSQAVYAVLGLMITAVGVPFIGILASILFDGEYESFFERIGKVPGMGLAVLIMAMIGPFGAMPRCITVSYASLQTYIPDMQLQTFSLFSCILVFLLTFRKAKMLDVLGYVLTPVLLGSLIWIIVQGVWGAPPAPVATMGSSESFFQGLSVGYQTMDLLATFFFSAVVLQVLEQGLAADDKQNHRLMMKKALQAGCIGMSLLALVYAGFTFVSAAHSDALSGVAPQNILAATAQTILGPNAGIIASVAVSLACLTTVIALAAVFSEFLHRDLFFDRISYLPCLVITMITTFGVSTLGFTGIVQLLGPILTVCYPVLIVMSVCNILYKMYGITTIKRPVAITFVASVIFYFWM